MQLPLVAAKQCCTAAQSDGSITSCEKNLKCLRDLFLNRLSKAIYSYFERQQRAADIQMILVPEPAAEHAV